MSWRQQVRTVVDSRRFQHTITAVIVVNAVALGCETSPALLESFGPVLRTVDRLALAIFVVELAARFYAHGHRFFRDPWNWFDTIVVGVALVPASGPLAVLRALRVVRVLRLLSIVPSMRNVVGALLTAIPGMASIIALLALVLYVSAVMATSLFGGVTPQYFGSLGTSLFTLFQVMTGEAWPDIAEEVIAERPLAWIFFVIYILVSTFVVLNLFIAVVVNAMERQTARERDTDMEAKLDAVLAEVGQLRAEIRRRDGHGTGTPD